MSKLTLFIMSFCMALCSFRSYAQETNRQILTIEEMFSLADQNSKSLRSLQTGIEEAREAVKVARNGRFPEIDLSLSFSYLGNGYLMDRNFSNGITTPIPHFGNSLAFEVSQIIYAGGAISNSIAIARLQQENAQLDLEISRTNIRFLLIGYYLDLYKQHNMLQVYDKNIEQTQQLLADLQKKEKEGIVLKNDITRYELLLANLELARTQIRNTLNIFNHNLVTILGLPSNVRIEPDTNILAYSLPIESEEYWTGEANEHSPTLQQMALAVKMNTHQDKLIRAERLPTIVAVAGDHLDGPITIEVPPINKNFNYWYVGVGIKYSFSSLYKTQQAVNKSKLTLQRVKEQYDDVKEQTELAIRSDFIRYLEAYEQLSTQEKSVELAHQNYSVIHNRYQNDMALITDMLDASNSKLDAELQLANARINIIFNYYKLQKTAGNL